ncbi:MAG: phosphoribosyltransferase family protein [Nitrosopumilaceae archaeon]|nr:phosphoribosyltransferase family protein [Nitrosopumilaceae archaeon]
MFSDRIDAGKQLGKKLEFLKGRDPLILAIPRGGVVVADAIATVLDCKLDIIVSRKIGAPHNSELAIGAVLHDGSYFPNSEVVKMLQVPQSYIDLEKSIQMKEIERRLINYRGSLQYDLENKIIVIVDDGIATGATILVAALWVKKQKPKKVIIAVPVGSKDSIQKLKKIADEVVVLHAPDFFNAVGEFYKDFEQVEDETVLEIMRRYGYEA